MSTEESAFERKLREKQAAKGLIPAVVKAPAPAMPGKSPAPKSTTALNHEENAPTAEELGLTMDPEQQALDDAIKRIGIVEAYMRWCRKMTPRMGTRQTESIKVSCPNPSHPDKNPSAWLNSDKDVWHCAACDQGGDRWDMAAWHYGYPVPGYKDDPVMFRELREKIGAELGFAIATSITGKAVVMTPAQVKQDEEESKAAAAARVGLLPAAAAEQDDNEENVRLNENAPSIDWRNLLQPGSFLHEYMLACSIDTSPEEYHFWNGMIALGLAVGRDVLLEDIQRVTANLFVCLTGPSGAGKSRSIRHLDTLLRAAIPYDLNNPVSRGAKITKAPGSAEYLIYTFQSVEEDPTNPKVKINYPVRGLVQFDELSTLAGTASRTGSNLKPQLMELYDASPVLESGSLTGGLRRAENAFGSVISTTQNRSLRKLLDEGDDGSGFINRWIFGQGPTKRRISIGGKRVELDEPTKLLKHIHQWSFMAKTLDLSPDAFALFDEFFHSTIDPAQSMSEKNHTAVLGRMDLLMKKMMLLFAINRMESVVSRESVQQAIDMWPYLLATFGVVGVEMVKTQTTELQDEIIRQIDRMHVANGQGPTKKMVYDSVKRKIKSAKDLGDVLSAMVKLELIIEKPTGGPGKIGRPGMRYEVAS